MAYIHGTNFSENLYGTSGHDYIYGYGGHDYIVGGSGNDVIYGGAGDDDIFGGSGINDLWGGTGADWFIMSARASASSDDLIGDFTFGVDVIDLAAWGVSDISQVRALLATDSTGSAYFNAFYNGYNHYLTIDNVSASALVSSDFAFSNSGAKNQTGTAYGDVLFGSRYGDTLSGSGGSDTLLGGLGNDSLFGGAQNDTLDGGADNDLLDGGTGADVMRGQAGSDNYVVDNTGDRVIEISAVHGVDTVYSSIYFSLGLHVENLTLTGTSNIGGNGNYLANLINGSAGSNYLTGGSGNDRILGNAGNDFLDGGSGSDTLTGGVGSDTFVFTAALGSSNVDRILDFNVPADTIRLDNNVFSALTATGTLAPALFARNTTGLAQDSTDRVIYETDTGKLFYDSNGNAAGGSVYFATLAANLAVTHADFFVV